MTALDYAQALIAFESPSSVSNLPITDWIEGKLHELGFETERLEYDDANGARKASVAGRVGPGDGGIAYFGHTDVVPAPDWFSDTHGPFDPHVTNGRLYGRGSCDMKGSIACMLAAVEQVPTAALRQPVYITCTADEEIGYGGAKSVAERSTLFRQMVAGRSRGIIGEPTMLEVIYGHKGTMMIRAVSRGRAAHSSTREGTNANLAMIPFLAEMKAIHDETEKDPAWHNDEFDPPTISWNIGINDFTYAANITPPQSVCTVSARAMPGQDMEGLIDRARKAAAAHGITFDLLNSHAPLYIDRQSEFVQEMLALAGRTKAGTVAYGTDGCILTALDNLLVCGPGDIAQAHTADEFITLDQLEGGADVFTKLIRHWCC